MKQGEQGVSLQEQRSTIEQYAARSKLPISRWFEEQETAAKRGRPVFNEILKLLRSGKAAGLVVHKIDRSARNLRDWADLGELIDSGIEVHFANESLDMTSRGGRLAADIQAVVASDYIRNLREEARKGFYGRIKQGFLPMPAPVGYLDVGAGQPKVIDPVKGPLVRTAFELYSTGRFNLHSLQAEMTSLGLTNRRDNPLYLQNYALVLRNPFYIGLIRLKNSGETFPGAHKPLIPKSLFDRVQDVLDGRTKHRQIKHDLPFRKTIRCHRCGYNLIGEVKRNSTYYRCHTRDCPVKGIRQDAINNVLCERLKMLEFSDDERACLPEVLHSWQHNQFESNQSGIAATELQIGQIAARLDRLTDALVDGLLEKNAYEQRRTALVIERRELEERLANLKSGEAANEIDKILEFALSAYSLYLSQSPDEKRELLQIVTSNVSFDGKTLDFSWKFPYGEVANRPHITNGGAKRDTRRTLEQLLTTLSRGLQTIVARHAQNPISILPPSDFAPKANVV